MLLRGDVEIPEFEDLAELSPQDRKAVMLVREGASEQAPVERIIRNVFLYAIMTRSSDVHVSGHGDADNPSVDLSVRTPQGMVNLQYEGPAARHFETKLFQLTNTPQGGSTPDMLDTRFKITLPAAYARKHGLAPKADAQGGDHPYRVSVRVAYIKTFDGYTFVCRLLDQQRSPSLDELGMSYALLRAVKRAALEPSGLILVSGPTGSGKTTTLSAILQWLIDGQRCVVTIENPVEYELPICGPVKQIEVKGEITFAKALRKTLRLDPEVILVGEIRDQETMEIALQAAQTGHLVFATVHANSAPETLSRALDLTTDKRRDAFRLAEVVKFVVAQRLINCYDAPALERDLVPDELAWLKANGLGFMRTIRETVAASATADNFAKPTKSGKVALVEAFAITPGIKSVVRGGSVDAADIHRLASEQLHYETLVEAGVRAVQSRGCRLRDCMTGLESTAAAASAPSWHMRLASAHGATLAQVAQAVDEYCRADDVGAHASLDAMVQTLVGRANAQAEAQATGQPKDQARERTCEDAIG